MKNDTPRKLLIATRNRRRFFGLVRAVRLTGMKIETLDIFRNGVPECRETGTSAGENARIKARYYKQYTQTNVLTEDDALFLTGLMPESQPAYRVKQLSGNANMQAFWREWVYIKGVKTGWLEKHFCLITPRGDEHQVQVVIPFVIAKKVITPTKSENPFNNLIIPRGFTSVIGQMPSTDLTKFAQKYLLPRLLPLLRLLE